MACRGGIRETQPERNRKCQSVSVGLKCPIVLAKTRLSPRAITPSSSLSPLKPVTATPSATPCAACSFPRWKGASIASIKLEGAVHEFGTLPGVTEDVTDIVLNLKKVLFKLPNRDPRVLFLNVTKDGPVTAGDIKLDAASRCSTPTRSSPRSTRSSASRARARSQSRPRLLQRGVQQASRAVHRRHRHRLAPSRPCAR